MALCARARGELRQVLETAAERYEDDAGLSLFCETVMLLLSE